MIAEEEPPDGDVTPGAGVARRGPVWMLLAVVAAALVICCCSAVIGVAVSWSTGLFDAR